jgi:tyrosinase
MAGFEREGMSRRALLQAAGAAAALAALPGQGLAQSPPPARWRRWNVTSAQGQAMLASYQRAIRAMLALPPEDPRNWYRNALVHTVDCPHGNWWFLVWHRAYVGWFEQTCRDLSGDPDFAFPYWDWTALPSVPATMYQGVLTPTDPAFIESAARFKAAFGPVMQNWWNALSRAQVNQLLWRGLRFPADLWFDIIDDPRGAMFFDLAHARGLPATAPQLDPTTAKAVAMPTLLQALGAVDFISFGSAKTMFHSGLTGFGLLEGSPHNLVHNCVGGAYNPAPADQQGFMQANLSPVDPLFFLHHSNIDRLWDVWTRKQLGLAAQTGRPADYPTLPSGYLTPSVAKTDWQAWSNEPLLFFSDKAGHPVTQTKAGNYASIGAFAYDYEPGSGEAVVPTTAAHPAPRPRAQRFMAEVALPTTTGAGASVQVPAPLLSAARSGNAQLFATVSLSLSPEAHHSKFHFLLNAPAGATLAAAEPHRLATFAMFGHHAVPPSEVAFIVPLNRGVAALTQQNLLAAAAPLQISVIVEESGAAAGAHELMATPAPASRPAAEIRSVVIDAR